MVREWGKYAWKEVRETGEIKSEGGEGMRENKPGRRYE